MKMNNKKARKINGMFEVLNSILLKKAKDKREVSTYSYSTGYVQFECSFHHGESYGWTCEVVSQRMELKDGYVFGESKTIEQLAWGGHEPSTVYLYDGSCRYQEFQSVVRFVRAALKNNGLDGMKFGRVKVVSEMTDYLDFDIED
jgi:hypothetical protein